MNHRVRFIPMRHWRPLCLRILASNVDLIVQACRLEQVTQSDFMRQAAVQRAKRVIRKAAATTAAPELSEKTGVERSCKHHRSSQFLSGRLRLSSHA